MIHVIKIACGEHVLDSSRWYHLTDLFPLSNDRISNVSTQHSQAVIRDAQSVLITDLTPDLGYNFIAKYNAAGVSLSLI